MFENTNTYIIRIEEETDGKKHYIVSFQDGQNVWQEVEVSREIVDEFSLFVRKERNLRRWDERHCEQFSLSEETLCHRARFMDTKIEDVVLHKELMSYLWKTVAELPEIQRRRFLFYFVEEMTYEQIAELDGCTKQSVKASIDIARKKVMDNLKKYLE